MMWNLLWPVMVVVVSNSVYHITAKSTPSQANAFGSLIVTYLVAAGLTAALFVAGVGLKNVPVELKKLNWTSVVLGVAIIGLEFGNLCIYRAGWKISVGSLVSNITLACVLLLVGVILFQETITLRRLLGVLVCVIGLVLISEF